MASETQIANLAAQRIGSETTILSLADDVLVARKLKAVWDISRRAALRDGQYNFAIRRASLASDASAVAASLFPFSYRFPLPADFLRLIDASDGGTGFYGVSGSYAIEGGAVLCDSAGPLYIRYVGDVTEPALWDDSFAESFAWKLACAAGRGVAGGAFDLANALAQYEHATQRSKQVDALESPPLEQIESDWITARQGGYSYGRSFGSDPTRWG